jgi:hypothetical protein
MEPHLHHLIEFELEYLPLRKKQEEQIPLDVGKDVRDTTGLIVCTTITITKIEQSFREFSGILIPGGSREFPDPGPSHPGNSPDPGFPTKSIPGHFSI